MSRLALALGALGALAACGPVRVSPPRAASVPTSAAGAPHPTLPPRLAAARALFPDGQTLWARAIVRTCGPNNGVCHNDRQFPDLQRLSGLVATIGQRCNLLRDDPATIVNLCEPPGDELVIGGFRTRIGQVVRTARPGRPEGDVLELTLRDPLPLLSDGRVTIERRVAGVPPLVLDVPRAALLRLGAGLTRIVLDAAALSRAPGPGGSLTAFLTPPARRSGAPTQVVLGDPNGDGVFGARLGGALVVPGDPSRSYLFLRVSHALALGPGSPLTNQVAEPSTEAQMPIANFERWDGEPASLALACWISGLGARGAAPEGPIDYARCDPALVPTAGDARGRHASFTRLYQTILGPKCAGPCHHPGGDAETRLHLGADPLESWSLLAGLRGQRPAQSDLPYVTRGDPARSYLYLKVAEPTPPAGERMPPQGHLSDEELAALREWILQGAAHD